MRRGDACKPQYKCDEFTQSSDQLITGIPDTTVAYLQKFEHVHHLIMKNFESCINDKQRSCLKKSEHMIKQKIEKVTELIC